MDLAPTHSPSCWAVAPDFDGTLRACHRPAAQAQPLCYTPAPLETELFFAVHMSHV